MTALSTLDKLKLASKACNSSSNFEQFIVNLDLIDITLDEVEKLYEENFKDLIRHMSSFWLEDRKFKLHRVFDDHAYFREQGIKHFALPYKLFIGQDKDYGNIIKLYCMTASGEDELCANYDLTLEQDLQAMHGIDVCHELFLTIMVDIAKKAGLERNYGC